MKIMPGFCPFLKYRTCCKICMLHVFSFSRPVLEVAGLQALLCPTLVWKAHEQPCSLCNCARCCRKHSNNDLAGWLPMFVSLAWRGQNCIGWRGIWFWHAMAAIYVLGNAAGRKPCRQTTSRPFACFVSQSRSNISLGTQPVSDHSRESEIH